jgi:hypothetical protein
MYHSRHDKMKNKKYKTCLRHYTVQKEMKIWKGKREKSYKENICMYMKKTFGKIFLHKLHPISFKCPSVVGEVSPIVSLQFVSSLDKYFIIRGVEQ